MDGNDGLFPATAPVGYIVALLSAAESGFAGRGTLHQPPSMPAECVNNEIRMKHFDVAIVGAGISGIGAACHLQKQCPNKTYVILESRDALGGTWDLYRYPGIRSDSDMHTLGYEFKPWVADKSIADGPAILKYLRETAQEHGVEDLIRYQHQLRAANWNRCLRELTRWWFPRSGMRHFVWLPTKHLPRVFR